MLIGLSIRDIVLIDRLDINFSSGLCVLTGETGAGKSIILDSLGLATGARADRSFVRQGQEKGSVSAEFVLKGGQDIAGPLDELDIDVRDSLILKRIVTKDGRTRAFVNDTPVAVATLAKFGEALLEIHGQHGDRQLMDARSHRSLLDHFGGLSPLVSKTAVAFDQLKRLQKELHDHESMIEDLVKEKDYLLHAHEELQKLDPQAEEEEGLAAQRAFMMQAESVHAEISQARRKITDEEGVERELYRVLRQLSGIKLDGTDKLEGALKKLEGASDLVADAAQLVDGLIRELEFNPADLDAAEERLFALRAAARKHGVPVDALPDLLQKISAKIESLSHDQDRTEELKLAVSEAEVEFQKIAGQLSKKRKSAAKKLDRELKTELAPLKLGKALFETKILSLSNGGSARHGLETVEFHAATNPNTPMGPIGKVASGGELARFALALKVVLRKAIDHKTLIFDEVDQGVGGAVADAVGERLQSLSRDGQVLVITHSPQVAARANHHWRIRKSETSEQSDQVLTRVEGLNDAERREEIARMLAGARVTDEARAAADQLLGQE